MGRGRRKEAIAELLKGGIAKLHQFHHPRLLHILHGVSIVLVQLLMLKFHWVPAEVRHWAGSAQAEWQHKRKLPRSFEKETKHEMVQTSHFHDTTRQY